MSVSVTPLENSINTKAGSPQAVLGLLMPVSAVPGIFEIVCVETPTGALWGGPIAKVWEKKMSAFTLAPITEIFCEVGPVLLNSTVSE